MKAKDVKWCPQHGYPLPCFKCGLPLSPAQQLDVYRAGVQDVVDWVEATSRPMNTNMRGISLSRSEWNALLESKGIEVKK